MLILLSATHVRLVSASDLPWELLETCLAPAEQGRGRLSRVITSAHFPADGLPPEAVLRKAVRLCSFADIGKIVARSRSAQVGSLRPTPAAGWLQSAERSHSLRLFCVFSFHQDTESILAWRSAFLKHSRIPFIILGMDTAGKSTRVFNQTMTPVTHPLLAQPTAAGQLSGTFFFHICSPLSRPFAHECLHCSPSHLTPSPVSETNSLREALGLLERKCFCLFGADIGKSPSPTMHNAGES